MSALVYGDMSVYERGLMRCCVFVAVGCAHMYLCACNAGHYG